MTGPFACFICNTHVCLLLSIIYKNRFVKKKMHQMERKEMIIKEEKNRQKFEHNRYIMNDNQISPTLTLFLTEVPEYTLPYY